MLASTPIAAIKTVVAPRPVDGDQRARFPVEVEHVSGGGQLKIAIL